jgi:hypothetical protein
MLTPVLRHGRIVVLAYGTALAVVLLAASADRAVAYTPNSPEVKAAIEKGIKFIESESDAEPENRIGARALQGYVLLLNGADHSHIKITAAVARIQKALSEKGKDNAEMEKAGWDIYSTGLSIIFLVKCDKKKYSGEIETLLAYLRSRQKPEGGWGYSSGEHIATGDTSMTQYGALSSWIAKKAGFNVPMESIERVANWLLKTQDPSGGFGYQGHIGEIGKLVPQSEIKPAMTAAASGSLYICADLLQVLKKPEKKEDKLPSALKEIKKKNKEVDSKERFKSRISASVVHETEQRAYVWLNAHSDPSKVPHWVHYYLYALERCMAFRYECEGISDAETKEPAWYNEGTEFLLKTQSADGTWNSDSGKLPDTIFSVLFLMRSTQKAIEVAKVYGQGAMVGGRGIPRNTDNVELRNGSIVSRPMMGPAEKLLAALERPEATEFDSDTDLLAQLPSDQVERLAAKYGDKIRRLVSCKSPDARLAAVKTLSKMRDLDNVETLMYALTDPDYRVVRAANEGLLRIRRVPSIVPLPDNFNEEDRRLLVEKWKAWYQTIRPSAEVKY